MTELEMIEQHVTNAQSKADDAWSVATQVWLLAAKAKAASIEAEGVWQEADKEEYDALKRLSEYHERYPAC